MLASPVPLDALVSMRLNAIVVDPAVLGPAGWTYLEKLCARLPQLGVVVCTGQSTVAQRVRGLRLGADDWVTKPCHPEEVIARAEAVVRRRRRAEMRADAEPVVAGELEIRRRPVPGLRGRPQRGPHAARVRADRSCWPTLGGQVLPREEIYERVWGYAMVHGDRSVDVFVRKLRQKLEKVSPRLALHPHALRHRLPVRRRARRGDGRARRCRSPRPPARGLAPPLAPVAV